MNTESKVIALTDAVTSDNASARDTKIYESKMSPERDGALAVALEALCDDIPTLAKIAELRSKHGQYLDSVIDECLINDRSLDKFKAEVDSAYDIFFQ